jgi:hypothetical protein
MKVEGEDGHKYALWIQQARVSFETVKDWMEGSTLGAQVG